jgi:hypothetical protein
MSDKAEELAKQLLEKTEAGLLIWNSVPASGSECYETDLEGVFSFSIDRTATGDNKVLGFRVNSPSGVVLTAHADNFPAEVRGSIARTRDDLAWTDILTESVDASKIVRFRLFSDLFHAARKNAVVENQTIEKVQQLLERLG